MDKINTNKEIQNDRYTTYVKKINGKEKLITEKLKDRPVISDRSWIDKLKKGETIEVTTILASHDS